MKSRRKRRSAPVNPFALYSEMMDAGLQMMELWSASAQVIARRGEMLSRAMTGELPWHHREFMTMWVEKGLAGGESARELMRLAHLSPPEVTLGSIMRAVKPYSRRASANARRLRQP